MPEADPVRSIGALAKETGVSPRTIRYYEELGILPPLSRSHGVNRRYDSRYVFFIQGALALKDIGFSLDQIQVLSLWTMDRTDDPEVVARAEQLVDSKIGDLRERIALLQRVEGVIDSRCSRPALERREHDVEAQAATMGIGELARRAGVSQRTIRYYEEMDILPSPARSEAGTRRYSEDYVFYIVGARALKEIGFTLEEIALVTRWTLGATDDANEIATAKRLVSDKAGELERKIRTLIRVEAVLSGRRKLTDGGRRGHDINPNEIVDMLTEE